jgi:HPt (histidine-containing phosphotransfer) domain-containing protein
MSEALCARRPDERTPMDQGSVRHFVKTSSPSERPSPVVLVLGKPRPEAPVGTAAVAPVPPTPLRRAGHEDDHGLPLHLGTLLENASGEPALVADLLTSFAAEFPERRTALHDAVASEDAGALTGSARALESELLALGATTAAAIAGELAALGRGGVTAGAADLLADLDREADLLLGLACDTDRLTAALIRASA